MSRIKWFSFSLFGLLWTLCFVSCSKEDIVVLKIPAPSYLNNPNDREIIYRDAFPFTQWKNDNCNNTLHEFRTSQDAFRVIEESQKPNNYDASFVPSRKGLDVLDISGSGQIDDTSLPILISRLNDIHVKTSQIVVVDLRSEIHGFFNGTGVSLSSSRGWGNIGKAISEIINDERDSLYLHLNKHLIVSGEEFNVELVNTESEICDKRGITYKRIPALDYTPFPSDILLDEFISFVRNLPPNSWLHFHCAQGRGRTSLFMVLYDMMKNPELNMDDIIYRQYLLGGDFCMMS